VTKYGCAWSQRATTRVAFWREDDAPYYGGVPAANRRCSPEERATICWNRSTTFGSMGVFAIPPGYTAAPDRLASQRLCGYAPTMPARPCRAAQGGRAREGRPHGRRRKSCYAAASCSNQLSTDCQRIARVSDPAIVRSDVVRLPGRQRRRTEPAQDDLGAELDAVAPEQVASFGERIVTLIEAESSWRAIYGGQAGDAESGLSRLIAWALIEADDGDRRVVGLVVDPLDRLSIVAADRARAPRGSLTGYGHKEA
jgi:hypothetical protein